MTKATHYNKPVKPNVVISDNYPMRGYPLKGKISITLEGITYDSIKSAAAAYSIDPVIFEARLYQGMTPEQAAKLVPYKRNKLPANHSIEHFGREVDVNGYKFISHKAAAAHFGISNRTFSNRINKGYTPERAAGLEYKINSQLIEDDLVIEGVSYASISAAARAYGVSKQLFHQRLKKGLCLEACAGIAARNSLTVEGMYFKNKSKAAEYYGVKPNTLTVRLRRGKTLEQALGLAPKGS